MTVDAVTFNVKLDYVNESPLLSGDSSFMLSGGSIGLNNCSKLLSFLLLPNCGSVIHMKRFALILILSIPMSGCVVGTAVGIAKDIVVGTVDIATDVVGTAVDVVTPGKKKK